MSPYAKKAKQSLEFESRNPWSLRKWLILLGSVVAIFILVPAVLIFLPIWDIEPIDDSDLLIIPEQVPPEQNGWETLKKHYLDNEAAFVDFDHNWRYEPEEYSAELTEWVHRTKIEELFDLIFSYPYAHPKHPWSTDSKDLLIFDSLFGALHWHTYIQSEVPEKLTSLEQRWRLFKMIQGGSFYTLETLYWMNECKRHRQPHLLSES